jgi:hypothetical protein
MAWIVAGLSVVLFVIGTWGRGRVGDLVSPVLEQEDQEKNARVMKRGAVVLQFAGVLMFAVSVFAIVMALVRG